MTTWVNRWNDWIADEAEMPGVWMRRDGGFRIRGRATDPKTGGLRGVNRALPDCKKPREAAATLEAELAKIRAGAADPARGSRLPTFGEWAATVFETKVAEGHITAASGRDKWAAILKHHLVPAFGPIFVDQLSTDDVERWKLQMLAPRTKTKGKPGKQRKIEAGRYSPHTVNSALEVLRQVTKAAAKRYRIFDPAADVSNVSLRAHRTYTYEEPNAIKPADVPRFLSALRTRFPNHYAFCFLGFTTGLRPSSLRPLRRRGAGADIKWNDGKLIVRRSHTRGSEVMDATKTGSDQFIALDPEQVSVLRWHCERLDQRAAALARKPETAAIAEALKASDLLFPAPPTRWSKGGGFRSRSSLRKAFEQLSAELKLGYEVSPRAMRRTYQDLARAAGVADIVTRAVSGHATENMQRHYSTVSDAEVRDGLAKVINIATGRELATKKAKTKRGRRAA